MLFEEGAADVNVEAVGEEFVEDVAAFFDSFGLVGGRVCVVVEKMLQIY